MSKRGVGLLLLLTGSEAIGIAAGQWFLSLFERQVPALPGAAPDFGRAHFVFLGAGALLGLVVFAWAFLAVAIARLLARPQPRGDAAARARE